MLSDRRTRSAPAPVPSIRRHSRGEGLGGDLFHGGNGFTGSATRSRSAVDGDGAVVVVARQHARADLEVDVGDARQRCHFSGAVLDVDGGDIADGAAVFVLRQHLHGPGAAIQVEVVDIVATECRLQGREHVGERDVQRPRLVAVDVEADLRGLGFEGREHGRRARGPGWPRP